MLIKVTVEFPWSGCTEEVDIEVDDDASEEEIEKEVWAAARDATLELIETRWEIIDG